jgi:TatD DNase family protein
MGLIDTHCHLYVKEFEADLGEVMGRAETAGVTKFYMPAIDSETLAAMLELEKQFPSKCLSMAGLHPCSVKENYKDELKIVEDILLQRSFAAIGEIGLDFYWDRTFEQQQYETFHLQIEWALKYDLPIVIHSRDSMEQCIDVVREHQNGKLKGIFHCFTGSAESAEKITGLGFYLGIGGVLTYKNSGLAETLKNISLDFMVLETDAPYLTPVPFRGKRNESSYLKYVAQKLAEVKNVDISQIENITTANAEKIFRAST